MESRGGYEEGGPSADRWFWCVCAVMSTCSNCVHHRFMHPPSQPGTVVSVAEIDISLPQSGRQAYGQEMTSAVPVAMETWGQEGMGMGHLAWDWKRLLETMTFFRLQPEERMNEWNQASRCKPVIPTLKRQRQEGCQSLRPTEGCVAKLETQSPSPQKRE